MVEQNPSKPVPSIFNQPKKDAYGLTIAQISSVKDGPMGTSKVPTAPELREI